MFLHTRVSSRSGICNLGIVRRSSSPVIRCVGREIIGDARSRHVCNFESLVVRLLRCCLDRRRETDADVEPAERSGRTNRQCVCNVVQWHK
jgi:hypothetical protein